MLRSLTARIIFTTVSLLVSGILIYTTFNVNYQRDRLISTARESAGFILHNVETHILNSMHSGNSEDVGVILSMAGEHRELVGIKIFDPQGVVLRSSIPGDVGNSVNLDDYSIVKGSNNYKIIHLPPHGEVLAMIKPIYNEVSCHPCHGTNSRVIGFLDINYSLAQTKAQILESSRIFAISSVAITLFLAFIMSFLLLRFVKKPLDNVISTMQKVEQGDFSVRMSDYSDTEEMSRLNSSFNSMVGQLAAAQKGLEQLHFEQLERADRLASIGEMAAGIAHEIKNPLTGISAAVTIIRDDMPEGDQRGIILGEVLEQVKRLDKTVNDLLYFGKPSMPELSYVDINTILTATLKFSSRHRGGGHIEKRLELQPDLPHIYADDKQLQQVFLNLVLNAFQAMPKGGVLVVRSYLTINRDVEYVCVDIKNSGMTIPSQVIEKIFTPFFTTKAQGTGLGLSICSKLVKLHNGNLRVRSDEASGTVFTVELPSFWPRHNLTGELYEA